ncbi:hypothetical protein MNAN1_003734 [Malassezia nana]|uniref:Small ribosomal subunit protein mS29 n=1 Tax=Malassezia nana TaxID=180528 RepID=A0AAF0EQ31_9BASI|nr:hypothetical protein MNAN1_003734 [Malassezia nana]
MHAVRVGRFLHPVLAPRVQVQALSTSAAVLAAPKAAAPKKKVAVRRGQATGERRTGGLRKGGVDSASQLSKSTAHYQSSPDLTDLSTLDAAAILQSAPGEPLAWSKRTQAAFLAFGLPRELQRKQALQPRPRALVRATTLELVRALEQAGASGTEAPRRLLIGEPGCGKSTYLLQAVAHAIESKWAVLYVPRAIDWINSSAPYTYSPAHAVYLQPTLTLGVLQALLRVNADLLSRIRIEAVQLDESLSMAAGTPLDQMVQAAIKEGVSALAQQRALEHALRTLMTQKEVPFLVAIDDVQALYRESQYRDPDYVPLHAFELALPRALLSLVLAAPRRAERGAVLAALSAAHAEFPPSPELLTALRRDASQPGASVPWARLLATVSCRSAATRVPEPHAYTPLQDTHLAHAKASGFAPVDVGRPLDRTEAASLLHMMHREQSIWTTPNDEALIAKLVESDGNIKAFERSWRTTLL